MGVVAWGGEVRKVEGSAVSGVEGGCGGGAAGWMIGNGGVAWPVAECAVAGNLGDMFARLQLANDLSFRFGSDAPTIRIDGLSIAGS